MDQVTNSASLSLDTAAYLIADRQIRLSEQNLVLGRFATKFRLPERMGKTLRVTRHKRFQLPRKPLTEGVPPDAVALVVENVDVTVEQWGIVALLTDVALVTPHHPSLQIAIERKSLAMSEMFEREIAKTLMGGSVVFYPGSVSSRANIGASDKINTGTVLKTTVSLRNKGAASLEAGLYGGVIPPQMEADIIDADQSFKDASTFASIRKLENAEIGVWMSVRWGRGNFLPILKGVAEPGTQGAEVAGYTENGAGSAVNFTGITVVARDAQSGYERKISQEVAVTATADDVDVETPTSTAYVYDIYATDGATYKRVAEAVEADTVVNVAAADYTAGEALDPPDAPADGREVFVAFIFGKDAYGRVELSRMSLQSYITPAGASWSNPLAQGRKVGSKVMQKFFILDNAYFARIEAASGYSAELPA